MENNQILGNPLSSPVENWHPFQVLHLRSCFVTILGLHGSWNATAWYCAIVRYIEQARNTYSYIQTRKAYGKQNVSMHNRTVVLECRKYGKVDSAILKKFVLLSFACRCHD